MRKIAFLVGRLLSILYPTDIHKKTIGFLEIIYTGWLTRNIKSIGENSKIAFGTLIRGKELIEIGDKVYIGKGMGMTAVDISNNNQTKIKIGNGTMFGDYNHITACNEILIGKNLRTGRNVLITDNAHGNSKDTMQFVLSPNERPLYSKGKVIIGNNVWIGENACIMPGVNLGDCVIVGANSVVTKSFNYGDVVAGCPAKKIN